jgi:sugar phosphate isomerase/epimerase
MVNELALGVITGLGDDPAKRLEEVRALGLEVVQISYPAQLDNPAGIEAIKRAVAQTGIEITSVFCGFAGESYADIPTVHATVGLVPEATRAERVALTDRISQFAQKLGVARVAAHIGFIPEDAADPLYGIVVDAVRGICEKLKARGQNFALETGQETAQTLQRFIHDVGAGNLHVNFDPANMILYGNDQPIPALDLLAPWVDEVHCKDGEWPTEEGKLGHERPFGEGAVNVPAWIDKLMEIGFRGPLIIEREISGDEQKRDIRHARELLEKLLEPYRK